MSPFSFNWPDFLPPLGKTIWSAGDAVEDSFAAARARLVEGLRPEIRDEKVLAALGRVPRERFIGPDQAYAAYCDHPLPLELGQTISQPLMVALMTQALALAPHDRVLEIGTGSGYQAAVLAEIAGSVVTVERHLALKQRAERVLAELGYRNITSRLAGDRLGCREAAPYDAIIVTAAAPHVPQGLIEQLAEGGRLVIPVGGRQEQDLLKVVRRACPAPDAPDVDVQHLGPCRFVPLIDAEAWQE